MTIQRGALRLLGILTIIALLVAACGTAEEADEAVPDTDEAAPSDPEDEQATLPAEGETLTLGALYPLTGPVAAFGTQQSNGLRLAVEFTNEAGGVNGHQVDLTLADATSSEAAVSGAERLVQAGVPLIFGTASSGFSLAASPVAERAGVVYVETGALNQELVERGFEYYFRTRAGNRRFAEDSIAVARDLVAPRIGKSPDELTAVVLHEDGPFGTELAGFVPEEAQRAGAPEILSVDGYSIEETRDFTSIILRYRELQPDVIFWAAFAPDSILFWRQAKQLDYTPPSAIAFTSGPGTPDFLEAHGPEGTNGVLVLDAPFGIDTAGMTDEAAELLNRFETTYAERFPGEPLTGNVVVGFVGGWITLNHVLPNAAEFTPEAIRDAFLQVDVPEGTLTTGEGIRFEGGQNVRAFPVALEWQDGALIPVWPEGSAIAEAQHIPLPGSEE